jgi:AmiR/NasT family two-component response regulator
MLGALSLYARDAQPIPRDVAILAMLVADHASLLLRARMGHRERFGQVDDEVSIERAIGIVMAQRGCPPDQALQHLHEAATHLGVGLGVIAHRLVQTVADRDTVADRGQPS